MKDAALSFEIALADFDLSRLPIDRAMIGGRVSKVTNSIVLTTNVVKKTLGLEPTDDEQAVEDALEKRR